MNKFEGFPNNPNFTSKEYVALAPGLIGFALQRVEQTFPFIEINDSAIQLRNDTNNYQPYAGLHADVPMPGDKNAAVETRKYADETESVHIFMDYADRDTRGRLAVEIYDDGTQAIRLIDTESSKEIVVSPQDEPIKLMYCAQKLNESASLASQ